MALEIKFDEIVKRLLPYAPEKIILFGSHAWGNPSASSDVDVLVVKKSDSQRRFRTSEAEKFLSQMPYPIDVLVYTPQELDERKRLGDFFVNLILRKGKVLYER